MMSERAFLFGAVFLLVILFLATSALATGIGLGTSFYTIDFSAALAKVPGVAAEALSALEVPEEDAAGILADVEAALVDFPTVLPVPLLGGAVEVPLPFGVIDAVRISGGVLTDGILRGVADLFGVEVPEPLIDVAVDEEGFEGAFTADLTFSTFILSADLVKRFDLVLLGMNLGLGLDFTQGSVTPEISYEVPPEFEGGVASALTSLHLDGFRWSAFAVHGLVGLEIGPPFFRLAAEARVLLSLVQTSGWWGIEVGDVAGSVGFWIRF